MKIKKVITQREFLENMGIVDRAKIVSQKMKFNAQSDLYFRIKRLLSPNSMGNLFKVILAYKFKNENSLTLLKFSYRFLISLLHVSFFISKTSLKMAYPGTPDCQVG